MKELYQRHELSIQNIFFSAPSKTAKLANSALFISSFSRHSASLWFVSLQKTFGMNDIQGWPHCSYSILLFHFPWSKLFSLNIQLFLLRSCGGLGQRFILNLIRNPGLKVCILLAFRPQCLILLQQIWILTTDTDLVIIHLSFHVKNVGGPICKGHQSHINSRSKIRYFLALWREFDDTQLSHLLLICLSFYVQTIPYKRLKPHLISVYFIYYVPPFIIIKSYVEL